MFRILLYTGFLGLLLAGPVTLRSQDTLQAYFKEYAGLSSHLMEEYGIPASIILGVAYVESGGGNSRNCKLLNNHFGMKAGKRYYIPGTKHLTSYKMYESDSLSFRDFCDYLSRRKYYPLLKGNMDYREWVKHIGNSGYATAHTTWKKKMNQTIQKYKLTQFDKVKSPWLPDTPIRPPEK
jgi:flagellum-specific peptidoglycan hydrolase FlgJ